MRALAIICVGLVVASPALARGGLSGGGYQASAVDPVASVLIALVVLGVAFAIHKPLGLWLGVFFGGMGLASLHSTGAMGAFVVLALVVPLVVSVFWPTEKT